MDSRHPITTRDVGNGNRRSAELWSHDTGMATPANERRELGCSGVTARRDGLLNWLIEWWNILAIMRSDRP